MAEVVQFRFRLRGGTAAEWAAANPVLLAREPGVETDTAKLKFGDGATQWKNLPYVNAEASAALLEQLEGLAYRVDVLETTGGGGGGTGGTVALEPDPNDPGTFLYTPTDGGGDAPAAALPNTPFVVRWQSTAWEFTTLAAAQAAGFDTRQTAWFLGNPSGSLPSWARTGDVWTQE